jgi:drug/metabolite transporter (DMT)-like permease
MTSAPLGTDAERRSAMLTGVAWMTFAMSGIGIVDAIAKWLGQTMHGLQVTWGYFTAMLVVLLVHFAVTRRSPVAYLVTPKRTLQVIRAGCLVGSLSCLYVALQYMPLAEGTTISFTSPLFAVALAGPLLGERVGWRRWAAVLGAMAGAMLVVRPGSELFRLVSLLPFVGAIFFALFNVITRKLDGEPFETTLLYTFGAGAVMTSVSMPWVWQTPTLAEWAIFIVMGALGALAHLGIVRALENADVSVVAPLNYVRLIWALGLGIWWFGQWPDGIALIGAGVIVLSGLYVVMGAARGR